MAPGDGAALDLMTGQGRNALQLAALGWQVTGVDISGVGLRFAKEAARRDGVSVDFVQASKMSPIGRSNARGSFGSPRANGDVSR